MLLDCLILRVQLHQQRLCDGYGEESMVAIPKFQGRGVYRNHSYSYHFDTMIDFLPYICCKCWKRCCIYECQGSIFQSPTYHLIVIENVNAQCFSQASLFLSWCFSRNFFELGSFSGISIPLSSIFLFLFSIYISLFLLAFPYCGYWCGQPFLFRTIF